MKEGAAFAIVAVAAMGTVAFVYVLLANGSGLRKVTGSANNAYREINYTFQGPANGIGQ